MKTRSHHEPARRPPCLPVLLALFAVFVAATGAAAPSVSGIVTDSAGVALANIEVCLYAYDVPDFTSEHVHARALTDGAGCFSLDAPATGDVLLVLGGDQGAGRVKATASEGGEPVELCYPVRTEIVLLHDNDLHFNFNHREAFQTLVEKYRARNDNVFLLNAGDVFIRHPDRWPFPGEDGYFASASSMIETMNDIGYDAMTLGNHELDYISDLTRRALEKARFPLLGANIEITTDKLPPLQPYYVFATEERYSVVVLGLTSFNKEGVNSLDPMRVAKEYSCLRDSYDVFVALTHIGNSTDRELAEELHVLDVIIGGHTHGLLEEAAPIGDVLFARAGGTTSGHPVGPEQAKYLGAVTVVLENGRVVEKSGYVRTLDAESAVEMPVEKIAPAP